MKNMPKIGDKVLLVQIGNELFALPKGASPQVGDHIAVWQLGDKRLVTTGKSKAVIGNGAIIYPKQFANSNGSNEVIAITSNPGCMNFGNLPIKTVDPGYSKDFPIIVPEFAITDEYFQLFISTIPSFYSDIGGGGYCYIWGRWEILDIEGNSYGSDEYHGDEPIHGEILGTTDLIPLSLKDSLFIRITELDGKIGIDRYNKSGTFGMCEGTPV